MGGGTGAVSVEHHAALVEQLVFRRIEIFRLAIRQQCAPAKGHHAAFAVLNGDHQTGAEAVIGGAAILGGDGETCTHQLVLGEAFGQKMGFQAIAAVRCKADAEFGLCGGGEATPGQIGARRLALRGLQPALVIKAGGFSRVIKILAALGRLRHFRCGLGQVYTGEACELLNSLRKAEPFGFLHKFKNIAMLSGGEVMVKALLIIDKKARTFLGIEGREACPFAALLFQFHTPPHHLGNRQARANFVKNLGSEPHGAYIARLCDGGKLDGGRGRCHPRDLMPLAHAPSS